MTKNVPGHHRRLRM